jgi:THO complex subunit 2
VAGDVEDGEVDDAKVLASLRSAETSQAEKQSDVTAMSSNNPPAPEPDSIQTASGIAPPTPSQSLSPAPPRIDVGRNPSSASVLEKPHPGLPSRPDVSIPSHTDRHLPPRLGERRDLRSGRMDRSVDGPRDRPHDPYFDHRQELSLRDPNRPGDRPFPSDRERERHDPKRRALDPSRDIRDMRDSRDHRERVPLDKPRMPDVRNGRLSRNEDMPPPRALEASQGATTNTDPPINPARAAQIFGASEPPRSEVARSGRDEHRDRPSSRPHSPRRDRYGALERDHPDSRRTEPIPPPPYMQDYAGGRHEDSSARPMGPRSDRFGERGPSERARDSSAFQPAQPPPRPLDPDHGRLRSQPDPNYGRLNPTATSQIPSGPRDRNGRGAGGGNRMVSAPQQRLEPIPQEPVRPPSPDKLPPTGPASFRPPRRAASGYDVPSSAPISAPTTPTVASSTASVHSDRLKLIGPAAVQEPPLTNASMTPSEGVHPSRLPAFQNDQHPHRPAPPALQTSNINPNSRPSSPLTAGPPSGPRGSQLTNNNAGSPSSFTPPTGPSGSNDRTRAPMRQLAGINSTLQQAGRGAGPDRGAERGTSIRGRGGRNSAVGSGSDLPPSPAPLTPTLPPPSRDGPGSGQGDRSRDVINPDRAPDLFGSRGANVPGTEDRDRDRAESRSGARGRDQAQQSSHREGGRSGRRSHRNSRSRSPGRDSDRDRERDRARAPMDESGRGEYRDRGRRQEERDMGRPSRDGDKGGRNGNGNGPGRDMLPRPPNEPEWGGVGGAGGGAGGGRRDLRPSGDNRRDSRGDGNGSSGGGGGSGRKRRGEVGDMGPEFRGNDKRPRTMR